MSAVDIHESGVLVCVAPDARVHDTAQKMARARVSAALVIGEDGRPVGVVTERDLAHRIVAPNARGSDHTVAEIMSRPAIFITTGQTSVEGALRIMAEHQLRHLPLVDAHGKPVGMVSLQRLMNHRLANLEDENASLAAFVGADGAGGD